MMKATILKSILLHGGLLLATVLASAAPAPPRPNILLILADDMGYSDVGCYGGEIAADRAESADLASQQPDRVREMATGWQQLEDAFRRQAGPAEPASARKKKAKQQTP